MRRIVLIFALALPAYAGAASAQPITNVNECTFITDPIALKRCIDGFQQRGPAAQYPQSQPIPPVETPAQAERNEANRAIPPNTSYRDSKEWLGDAAGRKPARPVDSRVIDLNKP